LVRSAQRDRHVDLAPAGRQEARRRRQLDAQARPVGRQGGQGGGQHGGAEALGGADPHGAGDDVGMGHARGALHGVLRLDAGRQQLGAGGGELQARARAHQKRRLQRRLQPRDPPADRRRIDPELVAGRGQRAGARRRQEDPQVVPIEHRFTRAIHVSQKCNIAPSGGSPAKLLWLRCAGAGGPAETKARS
jgi:hypothetical protein